METKKTKDCCCKADLKKEVKGLVDQVEGYSKSDHEAKKKEVNSAFTKEEKKK